MTLPPDFHFSQGSLQDYVDCRRRFALKYVKRVTWPALETEPVLEHERAMQQGEQFHRLVQQHVLGIPAERLTPLAQGEDLSRWWQNYLASDPWGAGQARGRAYPEITLAAPWDAYRLLAKFDLIQVTPDGQAIIFDWKTSHRPPKRAWLLERLQTRVYPLLLVQAGAFLNHNQPFQPEQVTMVYWFAGGSQRTAQPEASETIAYNSQRYQQDAAYLHTLVSEIAGLSENEFGMTPHEERCLFCVYRSLCDRGGKAGQLAQAEADASFAEAETIALDFEQIAEIEF